MENKPAAYLSDLHQFSIATLVGRLPLARHEEGARRGERRDHEHHEAPADGQGVCASHSETPQGESQNLFATLTVRTYVWIVPN